MIDSQTGVRDETACACKPCPTCKGQGEVTQPNDHPLGTRPGEYGPLAIFRCPECRGSGTFTGDCELPGHDWPEPQPGGLLAEFMPFVTVGPLDVLEMESDMERARR